MKYWVRLEWPFYKKFAKNENQNEFEKQFDTPRR